MSACRLIVFVAISAFITGCDCGNSAGQDNPDGSVSCLENGTVCSPNQAPLCCSGICYAPDGGTPTCGEFNLCSDQGALCTFPTECCSLLCEGGKCTRSSCLQIGTVCSSGAECCSATCTSSACASIPGSTCKNLGESCGTGAECCSKNCQAERCVRAWTCSAAGDICYKALDCCNGGCQLPNSGGGPGTCAASVTVPGATECGMGGEPCDDSTNCCSHLCLDLGSGKSVCVLGSGCRERGELCGKTPDCCGAQTSGVDCVLAFENPPIGRCSNKQACQPVGNCCGAFGANCEQACCDGKKDVCRLDSSGLSRCFGGGEVCPNGYDGLDPNCCIKEGDPCQFRDQCCNLSPCIQVDGTFVCQAPNCVPAGEPCTPGAAGAGVCCNGLSCEPSGDDTETTICRTPTDTTADGGMDGGGEVTPCKPDQESCNTASECCSGICLDGLCTPPHTCVSLGGTCSGTSECCAGLTCNVPAGQANGTCESGSSCASAGQSCISLPCCRGFRCSNETTGLVCADTDLFCVCYEVPM